MNCARMSMRRQWENIGRNAAKLGWDLSVALTKDEDINKLIRKGIRVEAEADGREDSWCILCLSHS